MSNNIRYNKSHVDQIYKDAAQNQAASLVARAGFLANLIGVITIAVFAPAAVNGLAGVIFVVVVGCVVGFAVLYPSQQLQMLTTSDKVTRALKQLKVSLIVFLVLACIVAALLVLVVAMEFGAIGLLVQGVISSVLLGVYVTMSALCIQACSAALANIQYYVPYDQMLAASGQATPSASGVAE